MNRFEREKSNDIRDIYLVEMKKKGSLVILCTPFTNIFKTACGQTGVFPTELKI